MSGAYLYLLSVTGPEDLIKIGLTKDPVARWSSFHPRWFEDFDMDRSQLVETETRKDAQTLETDLHRLLRVHSCPMPRTLSSTAGGDTEWYRGAFSTASLVVENLAKEGFITHIPARPVIATQMEKSRERLYELAAHAYALHFEGMLSDDARNALRTWVEAHRMFGADIEAILPPEMRVLFQLNQ